MKNGDAAELNEQGKYNAAEHNEGISGFSGASHEK